MLIKKLEDYETLLAIRQTGRRRVARLAGGVFLVSALVWVANGLVTGLSGRSMYLGAMFVGTFGVSYLTAWAKHEITKESIELVDTLKRAVGETASE